jgi:hypothetical protein
MPTNEQQYETCTWQEATHARDSDGNVHTVDKISDYAVQVYFYQNSTRGRRICFEPDVHAHIFNLTPLRVRKPLKVEFEGEVSAIHSAYDMMAITLSRHPLSEDEQLHIKGTRFKVTLTEIVEGEK